MKPSITNLTKLVLKTERRLGQTNRAQAILAWMNSNVPSLITPEWVQNNHEEAEKYLNSMLAHLPDEDKDLVTEFKDGLWDEKGQKK